MDGILESIAALRPESSAPVLLMSYLNPLLSYGLSRLAAKAIEADDGLLSYIVGSALIEIIEAKGNVAASCADFAGKKVRPTRCVSRTDVLTY